MYLLKLCFYFWAKPVHEVLMMFFHGGLVVFFIVLFWLHEQVFMTFEKMQSENATIVFLSPPVIASQESQIKAIKSALIEEKNIHIRLMTASDFLEQLKNQLGGQLHPFDTEEVKEHIPVYIEILGHISEWGLKKLRALSEIDSVETVLEKNQAYFLAFYSALFILKIALLVLFFCIMGSCFWTCQRTYQVLQKSMELLRFWGASLLLLFLPSIARLFFLAFGSMLMGGGLWWGFKVFLFSRARSFLGLTHSLTLQDPHFFMKLMIGCVGSYSAVFCVLSYFYVKSLTSSKRMHLV